MARSARVPGPPFTWKRVKGPWFDNNLASLEVAPEGLRLWWESGVVDAGENLHPRLERGVSLTVAPRASRERAAETG